MQTGLQGTRTPKAAASQRRPSRPQARTRGATDLTEAREGKHPDLTDFLPIFKTHVCTSPAQSRRNV